VERIGEVDGVGGDGGGVLAGRVARERARADLDAGGLGIGAHRLEDTVWSSSSAGPSRMSRESGKPSTASARSSTAAAAGERSTTSRPMPTYCDPWPGKTNAWTRGGESAGVAPPARSSVMGADRCFDLFGRV
jgi:hypothetical protein